MKENEIEEFRKELGESLKEVRIKNQVSEFYLKNVFKDKLQIIEIIENGSLNYTVNDLIKYIISIDSNIFIRKKS